MKGDRLNKVSKKYWFKFFMRIWIQVEIQNVQENGRLEDEN